MHSQNHGKIYFGKCTKIGVNSKILCTNSVYIDDYTAIADNTVICDNNNHPINPDFRLYMRTTGEHDDSRRWKHSIIAACSVVTKNVPANCIAGGNPAKILKTDIDKIEAPISCKGYNEYVKNKQ